MAKKARQAEAGAKTPAGGMPVPSHLVGWVVPKSFLRGDELSAAVRCPCGSEQLEFHHPGGVSVVEGMQPFPTGAKIGEGSFFIIKAVCVACRSEHVLFNCDFHGHDGFLLHDKKKAALPRPRLWPWRCVMCGSAADTGKVGVILDFKDRYFKEGYAKKYGKDRWPDAYGSFSLAIQCCGCGHETPVWVDYEAR